MNTDDSPPRSPSDDRPADRNGVGDGNAPADDRPAVGRRTLMKGIGASAAGAVALGSDYGLTREAEAIAPLVGAAVVGGSVAAGWALREFNIIGSDPPPQGLTASALEQSAYETLKTRKSTNASTFVDNQNILDGVEHNAYIEAKVAAIEALNAGSSKTDVQGAATASIDSYHTTVKRNLLKSWNESIRELNQVASLLDDHPDTSSAAIAGPEDPRNAPGGQILAGTVQDPYTETVTLPDGTTIETLGPKSDYSGHYGNGIGGYSLSMQQYFYSTTFGAEDELEEPSTDLIAVTYNGETFEYLHKDDWNSLITTMDTKFSNARDGIILWVDTVYDQVEAGQIDVSDLVTPREQAQMMADEEGANQAIADLIALNVSVDPKREATVTFDSTGATLSGTFGLSDASDGPLTASTTYDPTNFNGDVYFTADMSLVEGEWTSYQTDVTDGIITISSEPYESTAIEITTGAGETISVPAVNWAETSSGGSWEYDATDDLSTVNTTVESASFSSTATETQYETVRVTGSFTIESFVNTETGETATETTFSSTTPQDDSNYITQSEWDQLEQQNKELIDQYEQESAGGGGLDLGGLDMFGVPGEIVAVGAAAVIGLLTLNN